MRKLYLRNCSYCGLGMSRGYVMGSGDTYVCDRDDTCYQNYLIEIDNIAKKCSGLRSTGAAAIDLALVASGKTDAFWQRNLKIWDISSGVLLVREAGGKVTQPSGDKWTIEKSDILVSNNFIHNQFLEELNSK